MNKLNREEMLIGGLYGFSFTVAWIYFLAIPVSFLSAYLWALSGSGESKLFRRLGCPLIISLSISIAKNSWIPMLSIPLCFAALSIGYGIPSTQPYDPGSTLGKFYYKISKKHADLLTRSTIYALLLISHTVPLLFI